MKKIKKGDDVIVITGKDKGKRGTVLQVVDDQKIIVENINIVRKHRKPNPQAGEPGGIVDRAMPIQISNVALYNPIKSSPDRVGFKFLEDGRKVRIFKSTGEIVDV